MEGAPLATVFLGRVDYGTTIRFQEELRAKVLGGDPLSERLLIVEHPSVITVGRSADGAHFLASPALLAARGVAVEHASRGGALTYHGPGQLVIYPVIRLRRGVIAHVEALAEAVVRVAASYGVTAAFRRDRPGVWVESADAGAPARKLAAIGVHVHRRVAIHGLAFNISCDLEPFSFIVPCGDPAARPTSLSIECARPIALGEVVPSLSSELSKALGRPLAWIDPDASIQSLLSRSATVE